MAAKGEIVENSIKDLVVTGELSKLTDDQRTQHYLQVCASLGLDYKIHPLEYLWVDDPRTERRLILYVLRAGSDALRHQNGIDITDLIPTITNDVVSYMAKAKDKHGRTDMSIGAVSIQGKNSHDRANAMMAAETKAKRRVTLALSGCGLLDESEVADMLMKIRSVDAGIGVTAPPPPVMAPIVAISDAPAKEITPAHPLDKLPDEVFSLEPAVVLEPRTEKKDSRIEMYKLEVLQKGGMKSEVGRAFGWKWSKYVLSHFPEIKSLKDLTMPQWKPILDKLDEVRATTGDKGVVFHIEEHLAKAGLL
jgi:hypothetical protein